MQCPGLVRVAEHLHHAGEVMVRQVAAQAGVGLREQLRGLEALQFADDDLSHMGGDDAGLTAAVDVIVASRLKCFHQRTLAAVTKSHDGETGAFRIRANDPSDFECTHLAHVGSTQDRPGSIVFESGQRISRLRAGGYFKAFAFQGIAEALGKVHVAVDRKSTRLNSSHEWTSYAVFCLKKKRYLYS